MTQRLTTEEFIEKARIVHGDKFDYSKVVYDRCNKKIIIVCSNLHIFEQTPNEHLCGYGCSFCSNNRRKTTTDFINEAKTVHRNRYDYSFVEYINNGTKVKIVCKEHGVFEQVPRNHITLKQGCPECGIIKSSLSSRSNTLEFIEKAKKLHRDKYDYSRVVYVKNSELIQIICHVHGTFSQTPAAHLVGKGCLRCIVKSKGEDTINDHLISNRVEFKRQVKLSKCKRKKPLPFDFGIYNRENLLGLIEFHGKQHYGIGGWTSNPIRLEKEFKDSQERDAIKKDFCNLNGIPLLIIKYDDSDVIKSLSNFLSQIDD